MSIILFHYLLDSAHPFAQSFQSFPEPGETLYISVSAEPLIAGYTRQTGGNNLIGLNRMMNAGLRADYYAISDLNMADYSDLSGQHDMVSKPCAAGDAHLRNQETILAHYDIVRNHDEIIDLYASFYPGLAESRAVDSSVSADLNIIVDLHYASLVYLYMPALCVMGIPVSVGSNHGARMYNNTVAYYASIKDRSPGVYQAPFADSDLFAQVSAGVYSRSGAYLRIVSDMRKRAHRNPLP
jgi:hypothetical protein